MRRQTQRPTFTTIKQKLKFSQKPDIKSYDMLNKKQQLPPSSSMDKLDFGVSQRPRDNANEEKHSKKIHKFQLKCINNQCDDDNNTVISFGGYSMYSKASKKNNQHNIPIHNHKKIKQQNVFDLFDEQIPYLNYDWQQKGVQLSENISENIQNPKIPKLPKVSYKFSPFAPFFVSKHDRIEMYRNRIEMEEARQKKEIQKYEAQRQKSKQKNKNQPKKKFLKLNTKLEAIQKQQDKKIQNDVNGQNISQSQKKRMQTRFQQKQDKLSGFQVSQRPQPLQKYYYCYPCKTKYENYQEHIKSAQHRMTLKQSLGTAYFMEQMDNINRQKQEVENSQAYKNLLEWEKYLRNIADSLQNMMIKTINEQKEELKKTYEQIQKLFN